MPRNFFETIQFTILPILRHESHGKQPELFPETIPLSGTNPRNNSQNNYSQTTIVFQNQFHSPLPPHPEPVEGSSGSPPLLPPIPSTRARPPNLPLCSDLQRSCPDVPALTQRRLEPVPPRLLLVSMRRPQHQPLLPVPPHDVHPDGQRPLPESARNRNRR